MTTQKTVLIIEKNDELRTVLKEVLEFEGFEIYVAENCERALEILSNRVHVTNIFLDINPDSEEHFQFFLVLKQTELYKNVPIIATSTSNVMKSFSLAQSFITKPYDLDTILNVLKQLNQNKD